MKKILVIWLAVFSIHSNAALIDRGNGLIYDTYFDITWLSDANYSFTSGYDDDGRMTWDEATIWVDQLEYAGFTDWRLPFTPFIDPTCTLSNDTGNYGSNCINSEMGRLYYIELSSTDQDSNLFTNIQDTYWSSSSMPWGEPYDFNFLIGQTAYGSDIRQLYAWAVHDGDIGVVPIPATAWLFGLALIGFAGMSYRRKKNAP